MSKMTRLLPDAAATRTAGAALGAALLSLPATQSVVITLHGELGAGKTTLVSGALQALGHVGVVRSPTYTLIEPYELAGRALFHLDLYRLTDPMQLEDLGFRDLLQPGAIVLVEWPERATGYLLEADLEISLRYLDDGDGGRELMLEPHSESLVQLVHRLVF